MTARHREPDPTAVATFHELTGDLDYPMFIVTAAAGEDRAGCLIGFASQVSIDPPRFMLCLSVENRTFRVARRADLLGVHFVPADRGDLAELFGGRTGDEVDKFAQCRWRAGPAGTPLLEDCGNWFVGRVLQRVAVGDHHAFVLEPVAAQQRTRMAEFTFHRARRIEAGHPA